MSVSNEDLGIKISQPGDSFSATVSDDVIVNGQTVIAKGSRADGTVVDAKALGHFKGGALLEIKLDRVHDSLGNYPVETASIDRAESGKGKRSAGFIGGGAGLGAIIGGIAGGGKGDLPLALLLAAVLELPARASQTTSRSSCPQKPLSPSTSNIPFTSPRPSKIASNSILGVPGFES